MVPDLAFLPILPTPTKSPLFVLVCPVCGLAHHHKHIISPIRPPNNPLTHPLTHPPTHPPIHSPTPPHPTHPPKCCSSPTQLNPTQPNPTQFISFKPNPIHFIRTQPNSIQWNRTDTNTSSPLLAAGRPLLGCCTVPPIPAATNGSGFIASTAVSAAEVLLLVVYPYTSFLIFVTRPAAQACKNVPVGHLSYWSRLALYWSRLASWPHRVLRGKRLESKLWGRVAALADV